MAQLLIFLGGVVFPSVAGFQERPLLWLVGWALLFSVVTASNAFRTVTGLPIAPDTKSVRLISTIMRWLFTLVLMLIAYGVGWGIAKIF